MFKTEEQSKELLEHNNNLCRVAIIGQGQDDRADRRNNGIRREITTAAKIDIALLAKVVGVKAASELTGVSKSQVSNYKNGKTGAGVVSEELKDGIATSKDKVKDKALSLAEQFLDMVGSQSDLSDSLKAASIAEKATSIFERLEPKKETPTNQTQIMIYAPRVRESADYPTIEIEK